MSLHLFMIVPETNGNARVNSLLCLYCQYYYHIAPKGKLVNSNNILFAHEESRYTIEYLSYTRGQTGGYDRMYGIILTQSAHTGQLRPRLHHLDLSRQTDSWFTLSARSTADRSCSPGGVCTSMPRLLRTWLPIWILNNILHHNDNRGSRWCTSYVRYVHVLS